jgi:hypothetical protein
VLITSCAVEGCLQLIFTASTFDGSNAFLLLPTGDDLSPFFSQLHSQLPASCAGDLVTIHLGHTLAVFKGSRGQQPPPQLLRMPSSSELLQCAPICFEAGSNAVEVVLRHGMEEGVEAVVQCRSGGEEFAVTLPLQRVAGSAGSGRWVHS